MKQSSVFLFFVVLFSFSVNSCSPKASHNHSSLQIVGGKVVGPQEHAALSTVALMDKHGSFCTGSLIAPSVVVTAGHCLVNHQGPLLISFGTQAHLDRRMIAATKRLARRWIVHPQYQGDSPHFKDDGKKGMNDIALIQLQGDAPQPYRPIAMAPANFPIHRGERLILAGFGVTQFEGHNPGDRLRKVDTILHQVRLSAREFDFGPTIGQTSCNGDSGGPAFVVRRDLKDQFQNNALQLVGVTSRGDYCYSSGVYTDLRLYQPWIRNVWTHWQNLDRAAANAAK